MTNALPDTKTENTSKTAAEARPNTATPIERATINAIIRVLLVVAVIGALVLTIVAAKPYPRYFGDYPATLDAPEPVSGLWAKPGAFVTVSDPAIVTSPVDWQMPDLICMLVKMTRGEVSTVNIFPDYAPQIVWDNKPSETVVFAPESLQGTTEEGGAVYFQNDALASHVTDAFPYRVNWFGGNNIPILADKPVSGVMCVAFSAQRFYTPKAFTLTFTVQNIYIERLPAYHFRYHDNLPSGGLPAGTVDLQSEPLEQYLAEIAEIAPYAVRSASSDAPSQASN